MALNGARRKRICPEGRLGSGLSSSPSITKVWVPKGADHVLVAGNTGSALSNQTSAGSDDIFLAKAGLK